MGWMNMINLGDAESFIAGARSRLGKGAALCTRPSNRQRRKGWARGYTLESYRQQSNEMRGRYPS